MLMETSIVPSLSLLQNFGNLRGINRRGHVAVDDLQFSTGGLVCDRGYFGLDNFAAVEADPDAGAYAVIHASSVLAPILQRGVQKALRSYCTARDDFVRYIPAMPDAIPRINSGRSTTKISILMGA
jgi:hypothetical protein